MVGEPEIAGMFDQSPALIFSPGLRRSFRVLLSKSDCTLGTEMLGIAALLSFFYVCFAIGTLAVKNVLKQPLLQVCPDAILEVAA